MSTNSAGPQRVFAHRRILELTPAAHRDGATGHRAVIITADRVAPASYADAAVVVLDTLCIPVPCHDDELRAVGGTGIAVTWHM